VAPAVATDVLKAVVAMLASGDPSAAAAVFGEDYIDHQGLGSGPINGIDGFALVVRTNHAAYRHQEIPIEDLFGVEERAVARIRWRGQRHDGEYFEREAIDIIRVAEGRAVEHWGTRA
jgi:predicted SnoaL-like aldol condensation-catalyzing enzyme